MKSGYSLRSRRTGRCADSRMIIVRISIMGLGSLPPIEPRGPRASPQGPRPPQHEPRL